jgi:hypothetical protein
MLQSVHARSQLAFVVLGPVLVLAFSLFALTCFSEAMVVVFPALRFLRHQRSHTTSVAPAH